MKQWLLRCCLLLAAAGLIAIADAARRPFPSDAFFKKPAAPPTTTEPQAIDGAATGAEGDAQVPAGPNADGDVYDAEWVRERYDLQSHFLIDARPIDQYAAGHVSGAFHLDFAAFQGGTPEEKLAMLQGMPLIIYCSGGDCDASHKVQTMLRRYGFEELYVFVPGYPGLEEAGFPIEQGGTGE
jgi:rhodanese-related sulfurtransferase